MPLTVPDNLNPIQTLIHARKRMGLTQAEVARRLGRPRPRVSEIESGEDVLLSNFNAYAAAMNHTMLPVPLHLVHEVQALIHRDREAAAAPVAVPVGVGTVYDDVFIPDPPEEGSDEREP